MKSHWAIRTTSRLGTLLQVHCHNSNVFARADGCFVNCLINQTPSPSRRLSSNVRRSHCFCLEKYTWSQLASGSVPYLFISCCSSSSTNATYSLLSRSWIMHCLRYTMDEDRGGLMVRRVSVRCCGHGCLVPQIQPSCPYNVAFLPISCGYIMLCLSLYNGSVKSILMYTSLFR